MAKSKVAKSKMTKGKTSKGKTTSIRRAEVKSVRPRRKRLLRRVLEADPGQEYLVYVPSSGAQDAPLFVSVHGVSRNADQHARLLSAYSEMYGVVLVAPLFDVDQHPDFQRLGRRGRGKRSDLALNLIVSEVAATTGAQADKFYLFGFSGGAQFAHRYAMAHPHRIAGAVFASAGWYTLPDPKKRFPQGTRMSKKLPGVRFDAEEFLCVPMTVIVGADDDSQKGLRRSPKLDAEQGVTRVERARNWVDAMKTSAEAHHLESMVAYEEIEKCDHSFSRAILRSGLGDRAFDLLFGPPPANAAVKTG
jgi:poly(3-hydroxybutyrate) depolymerase